MLWFLLLLVFNTKVCYAQEEPGVLYPFSVYFHFTFIIHSFELINIKGSQICFIKPQEQ